MSPEHLHSALKQTGRRQRRVHVLAAAALVVAVAIAVVLALIVLDALLALSPRALMALNVLFIAALVAAAFYVVRAALPGRYEPRRVARLIEQRLGIGDSALINAVEFAAATGGPGGASPALTAWAIEEADQQASHIDAARTVDRGELRRGVKILAIAAVVLLIAFLAAPRLFQMVVPRYLNPGADLPPFTLLNFDVRTHPRAIYSGKSATIEAAITGPFAVEEVSAVFVDEATPQPVPMLRADDGRFVLPLEQVRASRVFYIDTPSGRSARHRLDILPVPLFERVTVRYDYPAYTGWPANEAAPLRDGQIRALIGTAVTLNIDSNLPLREGRLTITPAPAPGSGEREARAFQLAPIAAGAATVRGSFTVDRDADYRLTLFAADGTPSETDLTGRIIALSDHPPQVQLLQPDLRVIAPESWKLLVSIAASDDVGVSRIEWQARLNEQPPVATELSMQRRGPADAAAEHELDLAALGAKPGDTVRAFATAYDNFPGAQSADSATVEIRVVTTEQYNELAREQYGAQEMAREMELFGEQAQQLRAQREELLKQLEALKKQIDATGENVSDAQREQLQQIQEAMAEYAQRSQEHAEQLKRRAEQPPLYAFEPPVQQSLAEQARQHAANAAGAKEAAQKLAGASSQDIEEAMKELQRQQEADAAAREQEQQTEEQMRQLALADRMLAEAEAIKDIARRQRELEQHLSPFQARAPEQNLTAADQQRLQRLAEQQRQLEQELEQSLDRLEQAATAAGSDLPTMSSSAKELVQQMRGMGIREDQQAAARSAEEHQGAAAHKQSDSAADKLASLIQQCNGLGECAGGDLDGLFGLSQSDLSNALSQMAQGRAGRGSGTGSASGTAGSGVAGAANSGGGSASPGGMNQPTLAGPHSPMLAGQLQVNMRAGSYGRAGEGAATSAAAGSPQVIDPATGQPRHAAAASQGVPAAYRQLAEQYFRRLAQDSRSNQEARP